MRIDDTCIALWGCPYRLDHLRPEADRKATLGGQHSEVKAR
jgi:hypothetical protein